MKLTDAQLQAAFLAARAHGKILNDEILTDIINAVLGTAEQETRTNDNT